MISTMLAPDKVSDTTWATPDTGGSLVSDTQSFMNINYQGLNIQNLQILCQAFQDRTKYMLLENDVFERFLLDHEPSLIVNMEATLRRAYILQYERGTDLYAEICTERLYKPASVSSVSTSYRSSKSGVDTIGQIGRGPRMNLTQKTDLILREIEVIENSYAQFIKKAKRLSFHIKAEMEEIEIRSKDVNDTMLALEKLISGGDDKINRKISAEKFIKYMQDWQNNGTTVLEKLRLHTISFKNYFARLQAQFQRRQELAENVDEVDLEQLIISRLHKHKELRMKNKHLLACKHMTGKANLMMVKTKKNLEKQRQKRLILKQNLHDLKHRTNMLEIEADRTEEEVKEEYAKLQKFKEYARKRTVPPTLEYIKDKAKLASLKHELKIWKRRAAIQDVSLRSYTKMLFQLTGCRKPRDRDDEFPEFENESIKGSSTFEFDIVTDINEL